MNNSFEKCLENFINNGDNLMNEWLKKFNWSRDILFERHKNEVITNQYLNCPFNKEHTRISPKAFENHLNKCKLKSNDYNSNDTVIFFV
jgi:hypothetical protein